jgi:hypothetical protein
MNGLKTKDEGKVKTKISLAAGRQGRSIIGQNKAIKETMKWF